jgi:predicted flap endonuclease-1-like 5' DNA nuclease
MWYKRMRSDEEPDSGAPSGCAAWKTESPCNGSEPPKTPIDQSYVGAVQAVTSGQTLVTTAKARYMSMGGCAKDTQFLGPNGRKGDIMDYGIEKMEGIGPRYAEKLAAASIKTVNDLLGMCCDTEGRRKVAEMTGVSESLLLKWSHLADLMRVTGIGPEYSELLEAAGVLTIKELRHRVPEHLAAKMREVNEQKKLTRATPFEKEVSRWVERAKAMEPNVCESISFIDGKSV